MNSGIWVCPSRECGFVIRLLLRLLFRLLLLRRLLRLLRLLLLFRLRLLL